MIIRSEKPSDIEAIAEVTKLAFEDHPLSQQTEPFIIRDLRAAGALTISLVTEMPDGKFMLRPSALAGYDPYFAQVAQFRATEMSRVHKNPVLAAVTYGNE